MDWGCAPRWAVEGLVVGMVLPKGSLKTGFTRFQAAYEFQTAYRLHKNKQREISRCLFW
nr:hypothetical protein [uncultured Kingella sp.]